MQVVMTYISDDGTRFDNERDCLIQDKKLEKRRRWREEKEKIFKEFLRSLPLPLNLYGITYRGMGTEFVPVSLEDVEDFLFERRKEIELLYKNYDKKGITENGWSEIVDDAE